MRNALVGDSPGRAALEAACVPIAPKISISELARKMRVTTQAIRNWLSRSRSPSPRQRRKLERLLGIPEGSWEPVVAGEQKAA